MTIVMSFTFRKGPHKDKINAWGDSEKPAFNIKQCIYMSKSYDIMLVCTIFMSLSIS